MKQYLDLYWAQLRQGREFKSHFTGHVWSNTKTKVHRRKQDGTSSILREKLFN